ncbi:hypothetical protein CSUI_009237, partial [Cystoisospora suis]
MWSESTAPATVRPPERVTSIRTHVWQPFSFTKFECLVPAGEKVKNTSTLPKVFRN